MVEGCDAGFQPGAPVGRQFERDMARQTIVAEAYREARSLSARWLISEAGWKPAPQPSANKTTRQAVQPR